MKNKDLEEFKNYKVVEKKGSEIKVGDYFEFQPHKLPASWDKIVEVTCFNQGIQLVSEDGVGTMVHPNAHFFIRVSESKYD